jgi:hypothetical protein
MIGSEPLLKIVCPAQVAAKPNVSGSFFTSIIFVKKYFMSDL